MKRHGFMLANKNYPLDLNLLFGFWVHFNRAGQMLNWCEEFNDAELNSSQKPLLHTQLEFVQPQLKNFQFEESAIEQIFIVVPRRRQSIRLRMTLHPVVGKEDEFILGGWPFPFNLEASRYWGVQKMLRRPQCQVMDLLVLKDINTRLQSRFDELQEKFHLLEEILRTRGEEMDSAES